MTEFEKETIHELHVFIRKNSLAKCETTARAMTRPVHLQKHDVLIVPLTVLLHCLITSITRTLSY